MEWLARRPFMTMGDLLIFEVTADKVSEEDRAGVSSGRLTENGIAEGASPSKNREAGAYRR
jgi:hypothetical protein